MPFRDVFTALFFVSVGMLFNPQFVIAQPLIVLAALGIVLIVKPLVALVIVMLLRDTVRTRLTVAVGLAQIGEFSFILGALGTSLGILPAEGMDALVAAAIVSIAVNPLLFRAAESLAQRHAGEEAAPDSQSAKVGEGQRGAPVLIAGLGPLGRQLARRCAESGVPVRVVDSDTHALEALRSQGVPGVVGDPGRNEVLRAAGIAEARVIVVTIPALADKMRVCMAARELNPRIAIVATAGSKAERAWLDEFGAAFVCDALDEMTEALLRAVRSGF